MATDEPDGDSVRVIWTPTHGDVMTTWNIVSSRQDDALSSSHYQFWTLLVLAVASILAGVVAVALNVVDLSTGGVVVVMCAGTYYATRFVEEKLFWNAVWRLDMADAKQFLDAPRTVEIDAAGVRVEVAKIRYAYPWSRLVELTESRGMLLFWVGWRDPIVVPRREFAPGDLERARAIAQRSRTSETR